MKTKFLKLFFLAAAVLLIFAVSGCSAVRAAGDMAFEAAPPGDYARGEVMAEYMEEAPITTMVKDSDAIELYTQAGVSDAAIAQAIETKLIKNGYIDIEIPRGEFQRKFFEISALAQKYNGYVSNSQSYSDAEGKMTSGSIILRIDKANFDAALDEIKGMGNVKNVNVSVQDVTQEYVDNESRLKNLYAQQKRLLEFMEQSETVTDSIEVQRELSNVEGQIEVLKGRQNYLDNLISFSTIEVFLAEPRPITDSTEGGFLGAVMRGARGALTALRVFVTVLIAMSPILVIIGIILIIIWQSLRAKHRRRARAAQLKKPDEAK